MRKMEYVSSIPLLYPMQEVIEEANAERTGWQKLRCEMTPQAAGKIIPWDCSNPYLYNLMIKLYDHTGKLVEAVPYPVGFRKIEIVDKVMYLNGKRLIINGVNRHEWSAEGGRCIGRKEMERDMECFHANYINAVRTCHYPNQIPWYYMCDRNGIYMMAEANLSPMVPGRSWGQ